MSEPSAVPSDGNTRWRWLPVGVALAVWLGLLAMAVAPEWRPRVRSQLTWMIEPLFHDWHIVRLGWEAQAAGVDPLVDRTNPFNYPRFVLLAAEVGRLVPPNVAALAGAAVFLAALVGVLRPRTCGEGLLAAALVASPPVLLILERGNLDAWAFALVAAGASAMAAARERVIVFSGGAAAILVAALIKLYPVVVLPAAACLARGRQRWVALCAGVVVGGWLALSLGEIALILEKTTRGYVAAYGRAVALARLAAEGGAPGLVAVLKSNFVLCAAGLAVGALLGWRGRDRLAAAPYEPREAWWFVSGALIYAGTFFLGHNWAYRLVFIALCVPWLWRMARVPGARLWAVATLSGVAVTLLAPFHLSLGLFVAQQAVGWLIAFALMTGAVALLSARLGACADAGRA
ncbi:MAG: hypothetical protein JNL39_16890 [Opitutaceae bacterium]|nr:hypothetical protein [Opitutaceae bacterium]